MTAKPILNDPPADLEALNRTVAELGAAAVDHTIGLLGDVSRDRQLAVVLDHLAHGPIDCKLADGKQYTIHALKDGEIKFSPFWAHEFSRRVDAEDVALMYAAVLYARATAAEIEQEIADGSRTELGLRRGPTGHGVVRGRDNARRAAR